MIIQRAAEAKRMTTSAYNSGDRPVQVLLLDTALYRVNAIWGRTPLEVFLVIDIGSREQLPIPEKAISSVQQ